MVALTLWQLIAGAFLGLPILMFVLYVIGIQYQRLTWWGWVRAICGFFALIALLLDFILNWSLLSLYYWQWPERGTERYKTEWTFSDRLNRLCLTTGWRGSVALPISKVLNIFAYKHDHIPNAVGR